MLLLAMMLTGPGPHAHEDSPVLIDHLNPWGIALSADNTHVALSLPFDAQPAGAAIVLGDRIAVHDARTGVLRRVIGPDFANSGPFAFSPDGRRILSMRHCLAAPDCPPDPRDGVRRLFVETDLETGTEVLRHRTSLGPVEALAYDAAVPNRILFATLGYGPDVLASLDLDAEGGPRETVLHRWPREDGGVWRLLGGSADTRILFAGVFLDDTFPGLAEEVAALPKQHHLEPIRLFAWQRGTGLATVPLRLREGRQPRFALPLAATPDGNRVLLAATPQGEANLANGPGTGLLGLATELWLLEDGRATPLTQLCGDVLHAALSRDGRRAVFMAGNAVMLNRAATPMEVFAIDIDAAAAAGGVRRGALGIIAGRNGSTAAAVEDEAAQAACSPLWPDPPPGRIDAAELLQRIGRIVAGRSLTDTAFLEAALGVRLSAERALARYLTRRDLVGDDLAFGEDPTIPMASGLEVQRQDAIPAPLHWRELRLSLTMTGPCVTTADVAQAFGPAFRDWRPQGGGISSLRHGQGRPIGAGRSGVNTMTYDFAGDQSSFHLEVVFGEERCADAIILSERDRMDTPVLRSAAATACRAAPDPDCLADLAIASAQLHISVSFAYVMAHQLALAGRLSAARELASRLPQHDMADRLLTELALQEVRDAARARPSEPADLAPLDQRAAAAAAPDSWRVDIYARLARQLLDPQPEDWSPMGRSGPLSEALRPAPLPLAHATLRDIVARLQLMVPTLPEREAPGQITRGMVQQRLAPLLLALGDRAGAEAALDAAVADGAWRGSDLAMHWARLGSAPRTLAAPGMRLRPPADILVTLVETMRRLGDPPEDMLPLLWRAFDTSAGVPRGVIGTVAELAGEAEARRMAEAATTRARAMRGAARSEALAQAALAWLDRGEAGLTRALLAEAMAAAPAPSDLPSPILIGLHLLGETDRFEEMLRRVPEGMRGGILADLLREPATVPDAAFVARLASIAQPLELADPLAELALRRLQAGAAGEALDLVQILRDVLRQERANDAAAGRTILVDRRLAAAALLARKAGDDAVAASVLREMIDIAFEAGPTTATQLAAIAALWRRWLPGL